jgi:hypothetical protein
MFWLLCTFDLQFIFIYPGWEGSAADSRVLRAVLDDPDQNFPIIPEGSLPLSLSLSHTLPLSHARITQTCSSL